MGRNIKTSRQYEKRHIYCVLVFKKEGKNKLNINGYNTWVESNVESVCGRINMIDMWQ